MKINPEQSSVLKTDADQDVRKAKTGSDRFGDLLSQVAEKLASGPNPPPGAEPVVSQGPLMSVTPTQMLFPAEQAPGFESKAMDTLDHLLARWEKYAHQLTADPQGLRQANGILEDISTEINALKASWPQQARPLPLAQDLRGVLDELEVLAVTERIKFNRGDYF